MGGVYEPASLDTAARPGAEPEAWPPRARPLRAAKLGIPPALYLVSLAVAFAIWPFPRAIEWVSLVNGYLFLPLGREIIIPLMIAQGFSLSEAVFLVVFVDMLAASFIAWNFDLSRRLPYLGAFIVKVEGAAMTAKRKYPALEASGLIGLFLYALKPGRGSGGATSAVLGKIFFLDNRGLLPTILAGSAAGCTLIALVAVQVLSLVQTGAVVIIAALAGFALLLVLWRSRSAMQAAPALASARTAVTDDK